MSKKSGVRKYPIEHISYSALTTFLRNPWQFKRTYIDHIYDERDTPAAVTGRAFHKCMEMYYGGTKMEISIEIGRQFILNSLETTDWGLTGSVEKSTQEYEQAVDHYFHCPEAVFPLDRVVFTEHVMQVKVPMIEVPIKAVTDLILYSDPEPHDRTGPKRFTLVDFKTTRTLPKPDEPLAPEKWIQAAFNTWAFEAAACGKNLTLKERAIAQSFLFIFVKPTKNRQDEPQVVLRELFVSDPEVRRMYSAARMLVRHTLNSIRYQSTLFLPNVTDIYSGGQDWNEYVDIVCPISASKRRTDGEIKFELTKFKRMFRAKAKAKALSRIEDIEIVTPSEDAGG